MDKTALVQEIAELFRAAGHTVLTSIKINHREIDIKAEELQGLVRKTILIECADYATTAGVDKIQEDILKLTAAKEHLKEQAVLLHVSRHGYTPEAAGYAHDKGVTIYPLPDLQGRLVNFRPYIDAVLADPARDTILREYQPNRICFDQIGADSLPSIQFLSDWLSTDGRWLTILGDYGVGKSWTLRRFLYHALDQYAASPSTAPLPFFVPLQRFTKAFDFENLILRTLQLYGVSGIHYSAFQYLMSRGRIIFLLDSFDEMAQHLSRDTIRDNLRELLIGTSGNSKVIMTSRPNYFEGRAERLLIVEKDGMTEWHPLDEANFSQRSALGRELQDRLTSSTFARISDLTIDQRKKLFELVLGKGSPAHIRLIALFSKFQNLDTLSQRAVIARLLTSVAATLTDPRHPAAIDGTPLIPDDLRTMNESMIFKIILYNLLYRDQGIGVLSNAQRLSFLRNFAVDRQQRSADPFATPNQLRKLVARLFEADIRRTDTPQQLLEAMYRTCRRHSGLTTESQFRDTSGQVDIPVDAEDQDSRVGFSHNSLREYLVADCIVQYVTTGVLPEGLASAIISDAVGDFVFGLAENDPKLADKLADCYARCADDRIREILFKVIFAFVRRARSNVTLLGKPPTIRATDLSCIDLSCIDLSGAQLEHCVALDADCRKSDLRGAKIISCTFENIMLDDARLDNCDMRQAEIVSVYAYDRFDTRTASVMKGRAARQWLFSNGALVEPTNDLNPLLGKPWYEAAREVARTLERRMAGTHQDASLAKGTSVEYRQFASDFSSYLKKKGVLEVVVKSDHGPGDVVKVASIHREAITRFSQDGEVAPILRPFFEKHLSPN